MEAKRRCHVLNQDSCAESVKSLSTSFALNDTTPKQIIAQDSTKLDSLSPYCEANRQLSKTHETLSTFLKRHKMSCCSAYDSAYRTASLRRLKQVVSMEYQQMR